MECPMDYQMEYQMEYQIKQNTQSFNLIGLSANLVHK